MHNHTITCGDGQEDKTASQRALELRKFFEPFNQDRSAGWNGGLKATITSDGALDAFAETVLWRLQGVRTMVSLIDGTTQYFLAGAGRQRKELDDDLSLDRTWFGCSNIPTTGGLCEHTLSVDPSADQYPCFVVNDLSGDDRFANLPVVDGSIMAYRFYAGTPITTAHGVNIGSFFIFDDRPRPAGLTPEHRKFLFEAAGNVMKHLATKREAAERRRVALMSKGIAQFLETTSHVTESDLNTTDTSETSRKDSSAWKNSSPETSRSPTRATDLSDGDFREEEPNDEIIKSSSAKVLDQIKLTLDHAADIVRESLELSGGGVLFLDTALGSKDAGVINDYFGLSTHTENESEEPPGTDSEKPVTPALEVPFRTPTGFIPKGGVSPGQVRSLSDQYQPAKVLAMSVSENAYWNPSTRMPNGKTLQNLINTYPKGNIWYIDDEGYFSSIEQIVETYDGQTPSPTERRRSRPPFDMARQRAEADLLAGVFQNARQIVFLPLWDAGANRWYAGCFIWSRSAVPVFSVDPEIAYLKAFTNSMMVEISRLEAITANKMKSDFISSISHEFRSPLHGILASTEFLRDSELDSMQTEFISTIQNCGSTLLDTINHVLDYSKINSFEKRGLETGSLSNELYQCSDVALLCEDIVYGMMAAKEFTGINEPNSPQKPGSHHSGHSHDSQLHIILDFEHRNWKYRIQSGAIRRIIMNIFGNANKYTDTGFIMVQLRVREVEKVDPAIAETSSQHMLVMRIIDSGRGMATEYMERRLFTPFAQEDSFSPGIGLGLSIVWSIVNQLGGMIHVRSELGKGTEVEVNLPLEKSDSRTNCISTARSDIEVHGSDEAQNSIKEVRQIALGKTVTIILNTRTADRPTYLEQNWKCIERYFSDWFGFTVIDPENRHMLANVDLVIGEKDGNYLEPHITTDMNISHVLLIHDGMTCVLDCNAYSHTASVKSIWNPVGPYKLARAVLGTFKDPSEGKDKTLVQNTSLEVPSQRVEQVPTSTLSSGSSTPMSSTKQSISEYPNTNHSEANTASEDSITTLASNLSLKPEPLRIRATTATASSREDTGAAQAVPSMESIPVPATQSISPVSPDQIFTPGMISPQIEDDTSLYILAVDDNTVNLQLLHRYLIKRPRDVIVTARNGVEAVAAVRQAKHPFDIILMDLSMPDMDGFEATRLIRVYEKSLKHREASDIEEQALTTDQAASVSENAEHETGAKEKPTKSYVAPRHMHAYIVALTGLASRRDRTEAEESGFDDFLTKPISFAKIGQLLARKSAEKGETDAAM